MALTKRSNKGTALTHDEMDANFTHLGGDGSYAMPTTDGDSGQVMSTNGSGQVSFTTLTGVTATIANAYPVGSIYMNCSNSTNPATLLGFGTWSAFSEGRVLIGIDSSDTDFDTAEETGGSKTHTLTEAQLPSHRHTEVQMIQAQEQVVPLVIWNLLETLAMVMVLLLIQVLQVVDKHILSFNHILLSICGKE